MQNDAPFRDLLRRTMTALALGVALVGLCYFLVDRPVAWFVHSRIGNGAPFLRWLTDPPPVLQAWAPLILAAGMVRLAWGPPKRWERSTIAACVALILADQFKESLAFAFGRTWPETWVDDNPSLIRDGAFGFHPFHGGPGYESFPSGHMARMGALTAVVWHAYPKLKWIAVLATAAVAAGLVGMNYHFVSDVIAGALVGGIVGAYTACGFDLLGEREGRRP